MRDSATLATLPFQPLLRPASLFLVGFVLGLALTVPVVAAGYGVGVVAVKVGATAPGTPIGTVPVDTVVVR